jgi:DNA polymerase
MSVRSQEILKELGLIPLWRHREKDPISSIAKASNSSVTKTDDRRFQILHSDWAQLKANVASCTSCSLCQDRTKTVFGAGDENANWLCVGEAPGVEEDIQGEPFVGSAGKLLDNMLEAISLKRGKNIYIANIVKCRPPGNRNPDHSEALQCETFLTRQIELIRPKLIIALGEIAAQNLLSTSATIASLRGKLHEYSGIPLIVTYHPAYLLRIQSDKAKVWQDLCFARNIMHKALKNS